VSAGKFREDLLARINLWVFELPPLRERREDLEPNIDYELERHAEVQGHMVRFNAEARRAYLEFATSPAAVWNGNFRELSASMARMATFAEGGRITLEVAREEIARLRASWRPRSGDGALQALMSAPEVAALDEFDRLQLEAVIKVCRSCATLAEAGRRLFGVSRHKRSVVNDSDRLKKYLRRFGLEWGALTR
jgi:transcriptional regulatory protein RtcR